MYIPTAIVLKERGTRAGMLLVAHPVACEWLPGWIE